MSRASLRLTDRWVARDWSKPQSGPAHQLPDKTPPPSCPSHPPLTNGRMGIWDSTTEPWRGSGLLSVDEALKDLKCDCYDECVVEEACDAVDRDDEAGAC